MNDRSYWDRISSLALALSALIIAGAVVFRMFANQPSSSGAGLAGPPSRVNDSLWQAALDVGLPVYGSMDAKVTLIEFTDLECPACRGFQPRLDSVARERSDVRVLYVPHPLPYHRFATAAANAAECAAALGALQPWISVVYDKQDSLGLKDWASYASEAGIRDTARIKRCALAHEPAQRVREGLALGAAMGLQGTPMLVMEGLRFDATPTRQQLDEAIENVRPAEPHLGLLMSGLVLEDSTMTPVAGALVALVNSSGKVVTEVRTDDAGSFELRSDGGLYRIRVTREGYSSFLGSRESELRGSLPPHVIFLSRNGADSL